MGQATRKLNRRGTRYQLIASRTCYLPGFTQAWVAQDAYSMQFADSCSSTAATTAVVAKGQ